VKNKPPIADCRLPIDRQDGAVSANSIANRKSKIENGFSLVEVMVVMVLLSLIVLALMAVFDSAQKAFRAGVTQTDVLESGRATIDLMAADVRTLSPSHGISNNAAGAVNFYAGVTTFASPPSPLIQPLVGGGSVRTNVLEDFFILGSGNQSGVPTWYGVGYAVTTNSPDGSPYALYRFATNYPVSADPAVLFQRDFNNFLAHPSDYSHLMDGVVSLTVQPCDSKGYRMTGLYQWEGGQWVTNQNTAFLPSPYGPASFFMFSNTLPASVEIEMGVLEDRTLQRAESLRASPPAQANYLQQQAGAVHIFRQRVSIPNYDPSAYQ
jgi:prepilin-type N-terminal cleavage/methylation domain-containing protein